MVEIVVSRSIVGVVFRAGCEQTLEEGLRVVGLRRVVDESL